jgi:drug/metabolite transporter (DMT)-like permease
LPAGVDYPAIFLMSFINEHLGEFAALMVAVFWTGSAMSFETAGKKVGSLPVNLIRLVIAFILISILIYIRRGIILPTDATRENWMWLTLSGFAGLVFGDLFLFKSYTEIGSRFSMLIMTLVPPITAFFSWLILKERLHMIQMLGMAVTFFGISLAIFSRKGEGEKISLKLSPRGSLYAIGGALGQSMGLVLSKLGLKDYDPFSATQIRLMAGIFGFTILVTMLKRWGNIRTALKNTEGMKFLTMGAVFGPFLGVSFSLISVKYTAAGISATIMALVPVFIIIPSVILRKEKVKIIEVVGAVISVLGVALFFI